MNDFNNMQSKQPESLNQKAFPGSVTFQWRAAESAPTAQWANQNDTTCL